MTMSMTNKDDTRGFINDEDRVNCPFYFKIGCCRNGDRCNRSHERPKSSPTMIIPHMYANIPEAIAVAQDDDWDDDQYDMAQEHIEMFFEEVFLELAKYGEVEDMVICDNITEHMLGNIYVKYYREEDCVKAHDGLQNRFFGPRLLQPEFSPVHDFRDARCRAFHETRCARGGLCNFMHIKHVPKAVKRRVVREMYSEHPEYKDPTGLKSDRNRSRSPAKKEEAKKDDKKSDKARQSSEERRALIASWNKERQKDMEAQAAKMHASMLAAPTLPKFGVPMQPPPPLGAPPPQVVAPPPGKGQVVLPPLVG